MKKSREAGSDLAEVQEFILQFRGAGNEALAEGMSAYMKHHFVFLGVKKPERSAWQARVFPEWKKRFGQEPFAVADLLWQQQEREFQYMTMDWLRAVKAWKVQGSIRRLEEMILDRSWWDTVDMLAAACVGGYFLHYPAEQPEWVDRWDRSDNFWLNRTALLFQLKYKEKTDTDLLFYLIRRHCGSREFFIRKAIGWSLRELSKSQPDEVREFIDTVELSSLSRREATKYL